MECLWPLQSSTVEIARTLDEETDFVCSANIHLEGSTSPKTNILSSDQSAQFNLDCRGYFHTVEEGYNEVPWTFKIASFYAACVTTEAPDITHSSHATSLYPECQL